MRDNFSIAEYESRALLQLHGKILDELRCREVIYTFNNPVGDYATLLFCKAFNWTRQPNSNKGGDAVDNKGMRYEIKARRLTDANTSRQLSVIRNFDKKHFDYLAAVIFNTDYSVRCAALIPHSHVPLCGKNRAHVNGMVAHFRDSVLCMEGVCDITAKLTAAQKKWRL